MYRRKQKTSRYVQRGLTRKLTSVEQEEQRQQVPINLTPNTTCYFRVNWSVVCVFSGHKIYSNIDTLVIVDDLCRRRQVVPRFFLLIKPFRLLRLYCHRCRSDDDGC